MATEKTPKAGQGNPQVQKIEKRWGKQLTEAGWTAIPSVLLSHQHRLGLDPLNLNIILQIIKHWWEPGNPPFPSKTSIAKAIGIDVSTVRKRLRAMEKAGLLVRVERWDPHGGQKTNAYTFAGLIKKATPHAREELTERAARKKAKAAKAKPGAKLTVIQGEKS